VIVDIPEVLKELDQLEKDKAEIDQKLKGYLKELGW
jgi:type I restriction-modification system DNA methylase subunit